jgi:hypothetical protein
MRKAACLRCAAALASLSALPLGRSMVGTVSDLCANARKGETAMPE